MQVPLVGPLVYVPMQFAAAWLLNRLLTDVPTRPPIAAVPGSQVIVTTLAPAFGSSDCTRPCSKWLLSVLLSDVPM